MTRQFKIAFFAVILVIVDVAGLSAGASRPSRHRLRPIPAQILAAKKVFVANAGGDEPPADDAQFSGDSDRAYNQFYAAMKTWGTV